MEKKIIDEHAPKFKSLIDYIRRYGSHGIRFSQGNMEELSDLIAFRLNTIEFDGNEVRKMLVWLVSHGYVHVVKLNIFYFQVFLEGKIKSLEVYEEYHHEST